MPYIDRNITLHILWEEMHYDDAHYECTITFPVLHLDNRTIQIHYSEDYTSDILRQITQDIAGYLEDPEAWTKTFIEKGTEPVLTLRQLEADLNERRAEYERYKGYAGQEEKQIERIEQRIAEHKAKYGL